MPIKESATIDVGYPIYGVKFMNSKTLVVAGGGGEGNHGIPNKINVLKSNFKVSDSKRRLQRFREITLPSNEDSLNVWILLNWLVKMNSTLFLDVIKVPNYLNQ